MLSACGRANAGLLFLITASFPGLPPALKLNSIVEDNKWHFESGHKWIWWPPLFPKLPPCTDGLYLSRVLFSRDTWNQWLSELEPKPLWFVKKSWWLTLGEDRAFLRNQICETSPVEMMSPTSRKSRQERLIEWRERIRLKNRVQSSITFSLV